MKLIGILIFSLCLSQNIFAKKKKTAGRVGDQTDLDFEADSISGKRKVPLGSLVKESRIVESQNLVKIRYHWRAEIAGSANLTELGRKKKK